MIKTNSKFFFLSAWILFLLMVSSSSFAEKKYSINVQLVDTVHSKDFSSVKKQVLSHSSFKDSLSVYRELQQMIVKLQANGYLTSSLDSVHFDSTVCNAYLFFGEKYKWATLEKGNVDAAFLSGTGFSRKSFSKKPVRYDRVAKLENSIIVNCENNGFPFASLRLDSISIGENLIHASLHLERNRFCKIDSVVMKGKDVVTPVYIYNYIGIKPGAVYDESKVKRITVRLHELAFVTELKSNEIIFDDKQTKLNLYLEPRKASQFDGVLGVAPDNNNASKINFTGEAHLKLQNALRRGEVIELNWQQLAAKTQDLKVHALYPYILNTPIGIDGNLAIYKKDTTYIDVTKNIGVQYMFTGVNFIKAFVTNKESSLLNTVGLESTTVLPPYADISITSYGILLHFEKLDYRFNPRKGFMAEASASTGNRIIKKNAGINPIAYDSLDLTTTQYHFEFSGDYFISVSQRQVLDVGNKSAYLYGADIFTNELYRIGGLKTLRGFDEESIYASKYTIGKIEYRYLLEQNSFLFAFYNQALYEKKLRKVNTITDKPYGFGAGINFETKLGIMSVSYALGKQFSNPIYFRNGKVHFGIVSYF